MRPIRKRVEVPNYSFEKHARLDKTTSVYAPHVIILEGIYALHDPRIKALLDLKVRLADRNAESFPNTAD